MTPEQTSERIFSIITNELAIAEADEIEPDTNLITGGFLDSINAMRLVSQIERDFDTKIPPRDLIPANFLSIDAITRYLSNRPS
ncbi:acyl carrier protein [Pelagicoccus sp. SDUM812002]|uniref:acyl carrier protein n=1 Tax=Pelagicoccus sp. SDUM812002 TaxID=3041266 RepID=UPI00280FB286|nr:acyl carrier protein [Pelagicoccus sp. SDUM812002]MDQ8185700.1 acyl carrier protein [Pelagicoccus sp. SDUM812002]